MKAIVNADIIVENDILKGHAVLFDERIIKISKECDINISGLEEVIDAENKYLSPGFIDIHIHGCRGNDTMDDSDSSILNISKDIAATGVTAFLPATMTMEFSIIKEAFKRIRRLMGNEQGASILGCYLEGPYISEAYKGAHDGKHIKKPDFKCIEGFADVIRIAAIAPEEEGAEEFIESCARKGIVAAIGHTGASYWQAIRAIQKGAGLVTHTFNAMTPLHHRDPGVVGAAMDSDVSCELIADNIHVDSAVQRILFKVKGIEGIILVTDAMKACLLEDGEYDLGGQKVLVKGDEARLLAGNLAGSVLTLNKALKNFISNTGASLVDAVKTTTENPAKLLGIYETKGSLAIGKDADFTLFDGKFNIYSTYVKGKKVYERLNHENSNCQGL
ncbi:MAG TPA: N-acetylglucosamine-6-phosphate deacetylase [Clostridia bacterium]|nr:N-acetylglucosamine-6-phosphate deacetylase [Clostridia bacterium]